jgi:hypothetical protein
MCHVNHEKYANLYYTVKQDQYTKLAHDIFEHAHGSTWGQGYTIHLAKNIT